MNLFLGCLLIASVALCFVNIWLGLLGVGLCVVLAEFVRFDPGPT